MLFCVSDYSFFLASTARKGCRFPADAVIHMQESTGTHKVPKSASQAVLSRMQLTLHATRRTPHGASGLAQAMSAWSAESRPAPSRRCRDARVYIHSTTAMHDMSTPPVSFDASLAQRDTAKREALLQEIETLYTTMQSTNRTYRVEAAERRLVRLRLRSTLNLARLSGD